jgi:hypothetical protein
MSRCLIVTVCFIIQVGWIVREPFIAIQANGLLTGRDFSPHKTALQVSIINTLLSMLVPTQVVTHESPDD